MSKIRRPNTKQLRHRSLYAPVDSAGAARWQCLYTLGKLAQDAHAPLALHVPPKMGWRKSTFQQPYETRLLRPSTIRRWCNPVEPRQSIQYSALVPQELHHRAALLLLMPILTQAFLTLVGRHLMTLTLLTAWHRRSSLVIN